MEGAAAARPSASANAVAEIMKVLRIVCSPLVKIFDRVKAIEQAGS